MGRSCADGSLSKPIRFQNACSTPKAVISHAESRTTSETFRWIGRSMRAGSKSL